MAARSGKTPPDQAPPAAAPAPAPRIDTAGLDLKALAAAILAREVRPRVADVRRLAEAVLKKKKKGKKAGGKNRKLSKIPARKSAR